MKRFVNLFLIAVLFIVFAACSSDDDAGTPNQETARMSVKLVDAPGDYDNVFIDVQDVVIKYEGDENEVSIGEINTGVYDLLELTGGVSVLLVDDEIPTGEISQIRLILGSNNSIVVDGETFPLSTPSAQQSGLKIQLHETLEGGIFYEYILDFDVEKSIVVQGNGGYSLKPVIRATAVAETGAIRGSILPVGISTLVTASNGLNEISANVDAAGKFMLHGVQPGTYTVTITPDPISELGIVVVESVEVTLGEVTVMETIDLEL